MFVGLQKISRSFAFARRTQFFTRLEHDESSKNQFKKGIQTVLTVYTADWNRLFLIPKISTKLHSVTFSVIFKRYLLSRPVNGCSDLAQLIFTVSFWSVGLWHREINRSPSPADVSGRSSYKESNKSATIFFLLSTLLEIIMKSDIRNL